MRLLLISNTHGKPGIINELATDVRADAVIHAGDFGFFDHGSFERLSDRELKLHVAYSDLMQTEKNQILALSQNNLIEAVRGYRLLGEFQSYLDGAESFEVPIGSRQIIDTFFEQIGLFSIPVFQGLNGGNVTQCFLWDVVIIDLNVAFDGIGQLEGRIETGGGQDLGDAAVEAFDHAIGGFWA